MKKKTSETLELKINPADTTDDTTAVWSSSNEKIATVSNAGTVTAKNEGEVDITVTVSYTHLPDQLFFQRNNQSKSWLLNIYMWLNICSNHQSLSEQ